MTFQSGRATSGSTFDPSHLPDRDCLASSVEQFGRYSIIERIIDTGDATPVRQRSYKTTPEQRKEIDKQILTEVHCDNDVVQELRAGEYLVELKEESLVERLIKEGFNIESQHISCHPPRGYYTSVSIMGLRAYVDEKVILKNHGEIRREIIRLKYKIGHELECLENENRLLHPLTEKSYLLVAEEVANLYRQELQSDNGEVCSWDWRRERWQDSPRTAANYQSAIDLLKRRYGQTEKIKRAHINEMMKVRGVTSEKDAAGLCRFYDAVETKHRGLQALGVEAAQYESILVPALLEKIPKAVQLSITRGKSHKNWVMEDMLAELLEEVELRERCQPAERPASQEQNRGKPGPNSASALTTARTRKRCAFCLGEHQEDECSKVKLPKDRINILHTTTRLNKAIASTKRAQGA
ncbi:predicted protein [Nematostella vectensis]|uniref:Uncharacterized protein n=1 Tax=Nematostella vectensis TaxID=45351 RepID=A8DUQ0_NEMVE|nr:predicted protein [Nematostella vectensis]|eukprot:XP_001620697.1 hypothetical protein NEMVEDRAFT_v1g222811 [Nematostella vectensis]